MQLPPCLQQHDTNIAWCTVFLQTVAKAAPPASMEDDPPQREQHPWWKAKKWAYFNLNRLFIR